MDKLYLELKTMIDSNNIDQVAHSYINILTILEEKYKLKILELTQEDDNHE